MSFETTDEQAAASSTAENETVNEGAQAPEGSTPAASSAADETGAKEPDLLSVIKDAVTKEEVAASPAAEGKEEAEAGQAEGEPEQGKSEAEKADADAKLPFHEHPRWKEVVAERNSFREDAGRFRRINSFMQSNGLTAQEVGEGFDIMAKLKAGTPETLAEAREYFASRLAYLDQALGNTLPADLQERVNSGQTDEDTAKELARAKAAEQLQSAQLERRQAAETQVQETQARQATATAMATAVDDWERAQKAADPDYARKADLIETTCRAIVQRTGQPPKTAEEAVTLVKQAYAQVDKQFKDLLPKPKPIRPSPTGSSAPTASEPKSLREAINAAVGL